MEWFDIYGLDEIDLQDQAELWAYLASEIDEIKQHKDILGEGYIDLDISRDLD